MEVALLPLPIPVTKRHTMNTHNALGQIIIHENKNTRRVDNCIEIFLPNLSEM